MTPTKEMPLGKNLDGEQKNITGKGKVHHKADPLLVEYAKRYVHCLEQMETWKFKANEAAEALKGIIKKQKRGNRVKVSTEIRTYYIELTMKEKLVTEKQKTVQ